MSYNCRQNAEGHEGLNNNIITASRTRDVESTQVMLNEAGEGVQRSLPRAMPIHPNPVRANWPDTTMVDQQSVGTGMTDLEMFIAEARTGDCDEDARTATTRGGSQRGPGGVTPCIERKPDDAASTVEWREMAPHSQQATQIISSRRRQRLTAEERWRASLDMEIRQIRQHYQMQEKRLQSEIVKHEQMYEEAMRELEQEEKDGENDSVAEWWRAESDYQPTECGSDET